MDLILIFLISLVAGVFGTLVGGNSFLVVPALILFGMPADVAIATNRFGATAMPLFAWIKFHEKKAINYKLGFLLAIPALIGAFLGAQLVLNLDEILLKQIIAGASIAILIVILICPSAGLENKKIKYTFWHYVGGIILSFIVGIYGGLYGAGTSTFISYILILLFGQTFLKSIATNKVATFAFSAMATIVFIFSGLIDYLVGGIVFAGVGIGGYWAAHHAESIGNVWLKRLFITVVFLLSLKLFF